MPFFRLPATLPPPACRHKAEGGFLLVGATVLVLVISALIGSLSFVASHQNRFQGNYAVGQRLAWLAHAAHVHAQQQVYGLGGGVENLDLYGALTLPDGFAFSPVLETRFSVEVIGKNAAPVAGTSAFKAASAYIHLRARTTTGQPRFPNDTLALQSGANSGGLKRLGIYQTHIAPGDTCDSAATVVRWGPEESSCLNQAQANAMFSNLQPGDIIVPAWETALQKLDRHALMRYPQPDRPDLNAMSNDLNMGNNAIRSAGNVQTEQFVQPAGGNTILGNAITRAGSTATFEQPVNAQQGVIVAGDSGGGFAMSVQGTIYLDSNLNVADTIAHSSGSVVDVLITNNPPVQPDGSQPPSFYVQNLGTQDDSVTLAPRPLSGATHTVGIRNLTGNIQLLEIDGTDSRLAVAGTLDAPGVAMRPTAGALSLYTARMVTTGTSSINPSNPVAWRIGSIEQVNGANPLTIDTLLADNCFGSGCPTNVFNPPEIDD